MTHDVIPTQEVFDPFKPAGMTAEQAAEEMNEMNKEMERDAWMDGAADVLGYWPLC